MNKVISSALVAAALVLAAPLSCEPRGSTGSWSVGLDGGWNSWILANAVLLSDNSITGIRAGGLSFGADLLYSLREGQQVGLSFAYLPAISASLEGSSVSVEMLPLLAEIVVSGAGPIYGNLGLGLFYLRASAGLQGDGSSAIFSPTPGLMAKAGLGIDIKISRILGLNFGGDLYLPFLDLGLNSGGTSGANYAAAEIIALAQFNLMAGIEFDLGD